MTNWDAIVIGGGPAGSAAASRLARAGRRVLLVEKENRPHHKVCGEFISSEAQYYLDKLGLDLPALGAVPISRLLLVCGAKIMSVPLPFGALSLSRFILDEQLLQIATDSGVELRRGTRAASIEREPRGFRVRIASSGQDETLFAPTVFLATGKHDLRGWPRPAAIHNDLIGMKMHLRPGPKKSTTPHDVMIALFDGGYAGVEAIEDGLINVCLVISKRRFANLDHSWMRLLDHLAFETPALAEWLAEAQPCWEKPLAIHGIPYGFVYRERTPTPGFYRLGDQMAVIPSFFGNGISIALHSAFSAVESHLHTGYEHYHQRLASELLPKLYPAALLSRMMVNRHLQPLLFRLYQNFPSLLRKAASVTRLKIEMV